jgi:hypothetical protein
MGVAFLSAALPSRATAACWTDGFFGAAFLMATFLATVFLTVFLAAVFLAGTFLVTFLADDFLAAVFLVFLSVIDEK